MKKTSSQNNSEKFKVFGEAYAGAFATHKKNIKHFEKFFIHQNTHMYEEVGLISALIETVDEVVLGALRGMHKFYLPYATSIIDTKDFENEETINKLRLPYSEIAILTEDDYVDSHMENLEDSKHISSRITVAVSPDSAYWSILEESLLLSEELFTRDDPIEKENIICAVFDITKRGEYGKNPKDKSWLIYPGCIILTREARAHRDTGKPSIRQVIIGTQYEDTASYFRDVQEKLNCNSFDVMNLCLLLSLKNVEQQDVAETVSSKKRRRQQHIGNFIGDVSYKVLVVKGEVWDGNNTFEDFEEDEDGNKRAYRSHHRRGHIKRRKTGNYWWSPTIVHGNIPGFVEKDYDIRP